MKLKISLILLSLLFAGCESEPFNIYKELNVSEMKSHPYKNLQFLKGVTSGKISYEDDKLTPDLINGGLFGDRNLTKVKITKYFIYTANRTFEHKITIFVDLDPRLLKYALNYINKDARLKQIKSCKAPIILINRPKRKKPKIGCCGGDDKLPKGLLPPRLPDLSIGVDTPNIPDL